MGNEVVIVGAGGFGRDVLDVVEARNRAVGPELEVLGFLDDRPTDRHLKRLSDRGVPYLGDVAGWAETAPRTVQFLIGVGDPSSRKRIDERLSCAGFSPAQVVHPTAVLGSRVEVGPGSVVFAGVLMKNEISIGRHVLLNMGCSIGHDARIDDFVTINPRACISGECTIEEGVLIGVGAVVLQGLTVHAGSTVGGMACVVHDVPADATVKGVPAR